MDPKVGPQDIFILEHEAKKWDQTWSHQFVVFLLGSVLFYRPGHDLFHLVQLGSRVRAPR